MLFLDHINKESRNHRGGGSHKERKQRDSEGSASGRGGSRSQRSHQQLKDFVQTK